MDFTDFTAGPDDSKRLDKVIRKFIPQTSLSSLYKLIRKGLIKVNHKKTTAEYHITPGDVISVASFILSQEESEDDSAPVTLPPVIFKNEHIIIFDKPYDITVQGDKRSLDRLVQKDFKQKHKNESLSFTPGPLHRLDRKTTGLIAFSQSLTGAQWFSENIKNHTIGKKYIAVLQGHLENKEEWKDFITKSKEDSKTFHTVNASQNETEDSKLAHTICLPLTYGFFNGSEFTLAQMEIKTGRTHQIRAQSSLHHHPLFGDVAYGGKKLSTEYPDFFLQAYILTFPENNIVNLPQTVQIPYSDALKSFLKYCDVEYSGI